MAKHTNCDESCTKCYKLSVFKLTPFKSEIKNYTFNELINFDKLNKMNYEDVLTDYFNYLRYTFKDDENKEENNKVNEEVVHKKMEVMKQIQDKIDNMLSNSKIEEIENIVKEIW